MGPRSLRSSAVREPPIPEVRKADSLADMPRFPGLPFLGNLLDVRQDRLTLFRKVVESCGDTALLAAGRRRFVMLNRPADVYAVLVEHAEAFEKGPGLRLFTRPLLGNGLLTSDNDFHRRQRKLVAPAFQPRRLAVYGVTMAEMAARLAGSLEDGAVVDISAEMFRLTLAIAGRTLFGADVTGEAGEIAAALTRAVRHAARAITSPVPIPLHWPTPGNMRTRKAIGRLDETVYRIIRERRRAPEDRDDFLSLLLAARDEDGSRMTDRQVRDETMTLFLASHETTANALTWSWYLLSRHPEAAGRLREEARSVLGGRAPTYEDVSRLPYSLQVFKESLRLFPPAYVMGRQAFRDVTLGSYLIPAGTIVLLCPYTLHRRSDSFPDPEEFRPERFTPQAERMLPRGAYLPFSAGPRNCIGSLFALLEGQIVLSTLIQQVQLEPISTVPAQLEPMITLRPKNGISMRVRRVQPAH